MSDSSGGSGSRSSSGSGGSCSDNGSGRLVGAATAVVVAAQEAHLSPEMRGEAETRSDFDRAFVHSAIVEWYGSKVHLLVRSFR